MADAALNPTMAATPTRRPARLIPFLLRTLVLCAMGSWLLITAATAILSVTLIVEALR
jgi:hypothetical protein